MLPAEAEMKVRAGFCAGTPVAQGRSGIWGETGSQSNATGALVPHQRGHTARI